jgi:Zn-dependent peptidase ImmA (M78 family)
MLTLEDISRLRIGFMDIAVVETAAMDDEYQYGEFDSKTNTIKINPNISDLDKINAFLHEIIHAILYERGVAAEGGMFDDREKDEEFLVNTLSNGLTQVLRDNPKVLTVLNLLRNTQK